MVFRLDTSSPAKSPAKLWARAILLGLAAALLVAPPAPAPAAEGVRVAQSWQPFPAASRNVRTSQQKQQACTSGDQRPRRRPLRPAIVTVPDAPGQDLAGVAGRAWLTARLQAQAVPRQVLVVLRENQSGDLAGELARRLGLERRQSQLMPLLNGRCELYELRGNRSLAQVMAARRRDPRFRLGSATVPRAAWRPRPPSCRNMRSLRWRCRGRTNLRSAAT